jgi:hypothetical protein
MVMLKNQWWNDYVVDTICTERFPRRSIKCIDRDSEHTASIWMPLFHICKIAIHGVIMSIPMAAKCIMDNCNMAMEGKAF